MFAQLQNFSKKVTFFSKPPPTLWFPFFRRMLTPGLQFVLKNVRKVLSSEVTGLMLIMCAACLVTRLSCCNVLPFIFSRVFKISYWCSTQYLEEVNINGCLNTVSSTEIGTLVRKDFSCFGIFSNQTNCPCQRGDEEKVLVKAFSTYQKWSRYIDVLENSSY